MANGKPRAGEALAGVTHDRMLAAGAAHTCVRGSAVGSACDVTTACDEWSQGHGALTHGPSSCIAAFIGQGSGAVSWRDHASASGDVVRITTSRSALNRMSHQTQAACQRGRCRKTRISREPAWCPARGGRCGGGNSPRGRYFFCSTGCT